MLYRLAEASLDHPTGVVHEVIFPVVSEATLRDLVKVESHGPFYRASRRSCAAPTAPTIAGCCHYSWPPWNFARTTPPISPSSGRSRSSSSTSPVVSAPIRGGGRPVGGRNPGALARGGGGDRCPGRQRVNRLTYEMCVLQALRDQLRCKEIWVVGADRYRNPDDDVPQDFEVQRPTYYAALKLPSQAEPLSSRSNKRCDELAALDRTLPRNADVEILPKAKGWIKLSPLAPNRNPNLLALKMEITKRWPMTSPSGCPERNRPARGFYALLSESHGLGKPRPGHPPVSAPAGAVWAWDRGGVRSGSPWATRGLPTKSSCTSGAALSPQRPSARVLRRSSIGSLRRGSPSSGAKTSRRAPPIPATSARGIKFTDGMACALWQARHYDLLACRPQSGVYLLAVEDVLVLRSRGHDRRRVTPLHAMEVDRQYVDSHGQSAVAFAFCHLLGFQLLPRLRPSINNGCTAPKPATPRPIPTSSRPPTPYQLEPDRARV